MRSVECGVAGGVRSRTPGPAHRRWRDLFRTPHSALRIGSHDPQAAPPPRPAGDLGRGSRIPAWTGGRAALPVDPRLLSQLGVPQGPRGTRRASRRRRAPRSGRGDRAQGPRTARPDSRDRLVLPISRQDDPQVLPLLPVRVEARRVRAADGGRHHRLRVVRPRGGPPHDLLRQRARGAGAGDRDGAGAGARGGRRRPGAARLTAVVPVFNPRAEPRRAVQRGYPRDAGRVRLCRNLAAVERLLYQRLVDAVVLDVKTAPPAALALPARFPRIPMFVLAALRPDDGPLLAACDAAGFAGVLVEGVDNAVAGEWIAARTAQVARRAALADAPRLLRLTDRLQLAAWDEVLRRVAFPTQTGQVAAALRVTREHLSREFAAGGAPNLKRVIDLARTACAADLLGNPGYTVRAVVHILGYASTSHLAGAARRVAGTTPQELRAVGPRGVLARFIRGRTRSRI